MRHIIVTKGRFILGLVVVVYALVPRLDAQGQTGSPTVFSPAVSHRVTVTQRGMTISSTLVPVGMFLSVTSSGVPSVPAVGSLAFNGDVTLRVQPYATAQTDLTGSADMSGAPLVLSLRNVNVLIENVAP
jgi:hypothetical protein